MGKNALANKIASDILSKGIGTIKPNFLKSIKIVKSNLQSNNIDITSIEKLALTTILSSKKLILKLFDEKFDYVLCLLLIKKINSNILVYINSIEKKDPLISLYIRIYFFYYCLLSTFRYVLNEPLILNIPTAAIYFVPLIDELSFVSSMKSENKELPFINIFKSSKFARKVLDDLFISNKFKRPFSIITFIFVIYSNIFNIIFNDNRIQKILKSKKFISKQNEFTKMYLLLLFSIFIDDITSNATKFSKFIKNL